jgi:DNA-binding transcriptional MocR family regulator
MRSTAPERRPAGAEGGPSHAGGEGRDLGNALIERQAPGLWRALSALGRRVRQPADFLPQQSAEARGKTWNATIGQITDGHGRAVELPALAAALAVLPAAARSRALLYSPLEGLPELRQRWRERQVRQARGAASVAWPLPLVTAGPGLARQVLVQLFVEAGRPVLLPAEDGATLWSLAVRELLRRLGARVVEIEPSSPVPGSRGRRRAGHREGRWAGLLAELPAGEPLVVLGRAGAELADLCPALLAAAAERPIVIVVEDGVADAAPGLFAELAGAHPGLVPFLVEGTAKLGFPGSGLGFLTLPFADGAELALELEKKLKMLLRAASGSPPALSQVLLLAALEEKEEAGAIAAGSLGR